MTRTLLDRAKAGDRAAMVRILTEHQGPIRRYVARLAPDPATADDLAQQVFLIALRSLDRIDSDDGIRPYLFQVAKNEVRMHWRERRKLSDPDVFTAIAEQAAPADVEKRSSARLSALQECLQRLAPKAREVVQRHYAQEEDCQQIADRMKTTSGNIRSILTRSRQALRECIQLRWKTETT